MWSIITSVLVFFHLALELTHYIYEWFAARRVNNVLIDIQRHRVRSKKSEMLKNIQQDLNLIKKNLEIK